MLLNVILVVSLIAALVFAVVTHRKAKRYSKGAASLLTERNVLAGLLTELDGHLQGKNAEMKRKPEMRIAMARAYLANIRGYVGI